MLHLSVPEPAPEPRRGLTRNEIIEFRCLCARARELLGLDSHEVSVRISVTTNPERASRVAHEFYLRGAQLGPNYEMFMVHEEHPTLLERRPQVEFTLLSDLSHLRGDLP